MFRYSLLEFKQVPDLADLMPTLVAALGSEAPLVVDGRVDLVTSAEGIQQGSPLSTPDFCVAIHPEVEAADAELSAKGGAVRFYADDGYLVGLPADVWPVFHRLRAALLDALDLHVHDDYKTTAYSADMERAQVGAPPGVRWPQLDGHYGLEVLGVPLGSPGYISRFLAAKADEVIAHINSTVGHLLDGASRHHAWPVLLQSLQHKLVYWCRNCFPADVVDMCTRVDAAVAQAAERVHGVSFTSADYRTEDYTTATGYSYLCAEYEPDNILHDPELGGAPPPPDPLQFSHHTVDRALSRLRIPLRLRGGGLRSSLRTRHAAFWGSVNASFPRLVDTEDKEGEVVPGFFSSQLSERIGRGTFNETDSSATRYTHFMESSGSHYVLALREAWQHMQQEAALGNLPDEGNPLILPAERARGDQKQLTSLLETAQSVCLVREINRLPGNQRERRSYHNLDSWSSKWLQTFPDGPVYTYTDQEWQVKAADYFLLPQPAARPLIGQLVTLPQVASGEYQAMDPYGDCLGSVLGEGDAHYSRPHNSILSNITKLGTELGVTCEKEITGEFRQLLPADRRQEAIDSRIEGHRPDFKAHLPAKNEDGEWTEELTATWYELKCVHSGKRYRDGPAGTKTVEVRAQQLRDIAKSKLHAVDVAYHGTGEGQVGPLEAHLDSLSYKGLVFGRFGETSGHTKGLLLGMAARAQQVGRVYRGGKCAPQEIALLYRYLVHRVTVHAGKAFARFFLTRMRFAHPHRSTSRCAERVVRNVGAIVGDATQRTAYADITNSPLQRRSRS